MKKQLEYSKDPRAGLGLPASVSTPAPQTLFLWSAAAEVLGGLDRRTPPPYLTLEGRILKIRSTGIG